MTVERSTIEAEIAHQIGDEKQGIIAPLTSYNNLILLV